MGREEAHDQSVSQALGSLKAILTFVVEPVNPVDTRALVVPAEDEEVLWVLDLVRQ